MSTERGFAVAMAKFLKDRNHAFWVMQAAGWLGYALLRLFQGTTFGVSPIEYLTPVTVAVITGFTLTIGMRYLYRMVRQQPLPVILVAAIVTSGSLGFLFSFIETTASNFYNVNSQLQGLQRFGNAMADATALFAWSSLYFGFHYYRMLQNEREKALKAQAMAHQAQLKMLRYQLNPHFLFNTLNAISTLVLEKEVGPANDMLTRLSSFLRYTLVSQPNQRVSLNQELHTLGLYLDIEKVRFQDRLRIEMDIEARAREALVPSLLLQPLIENSIKYAIAPSIDGGTITVKAWVEDNKLRMVLEDDGPGLSDEPKKDESQSSGVGLVNTQERLQHIYGNDHEFRTEPVDPHGVRIIINLPCEMKAGKSRYTA